MTKKLKSYKENQQVKAAKELPESSGIACTEKGCPGEMMISVPHQEHYAVGRKGEPGAIKTELKRAQCGVCGWLGWV